jgi:hypothetical protein
MCPSMCLVAVRDQSHDQSTSSPRSANSQSAGGSSGLGPSLSLGLGP